MTYVNVMGAIKHLKKLFSKSPGKFEKSGGVQTIENKPKRTRSTVRYSNTQK